MRHPELSCIVSEPSSRRKTCRNSIPFHQEKRIPKTQCSPERILFRGRILPVFFREELLRDTVLPKNLPVPRRRCLGSRIAIWSMAQAPGRLACSKCSFSFSSRPCGIIEKVQSSRRTRTARSTLSFAYLRERFLHVAPRSVGCEVQRFHGCLDRRFLLALFEIEPGQRVPDGV